MSHQSSVVNQEIDSTELLFDGGQSRVAVVSQGDVRLDAMNVRKSAPKSGDLRGISIERYNGVIAEEFARNGEPDPGCTARDDNNLIFHMHLSKNDLGNKFTMHPTSTWSPALNLPDFGTDGSDGSHDLVAGNEWVVHAPHSVLATWISEWPTPQYWISITTS